MRSVTISQANKQKIIDAASNTAARGILAPEDLSSFEWMFSPQFAKEYENYLDSFLKDPQDPRLPEQIHHLQYTSLMVDAPNLNLANRPMVSNKLQAIHYCSLLSTVCYAWNAIERPDFPNSTPPIQTRGSIHTTIDSSTEFGTKVIAALELYDRLNKQIHKAKLEIDRIISSARTTKQLLAAWPQCEEFFPPELTKKMYDKPAPRKAAPPPPDVDTDALNTHIIYGKMAS